VRVQPLRPMLASSAAQLPEGPQWSYEVKFDGYRTLALKDGARVKLLSRNLKDATRLYPTVAREAARLRVES
jgi:bifunctional non-homologous end joining protein LigD